MKQQLIIIGNGMAPGRMLEHLLEADKLRYDITIYNAEPRVNYNRLMLSPVLSGDKTYEDIITHDEQWYVEHEITLHRGVKIVDINTESQQVVSADGSIQHYDKLVIATGSTPIMIPLPGHDLPGVLVYRDLDDVEKMLDIAKGKGRAVVIGGGLLGLEAAAGLKEQGMDVCVVHLAESLMEKQLDSNASYLLQQELERRGIEVRTATSTTHILGDTQVSGVRFKDGSETHCELVVMAVGIRPATNLAQKSGLNVNHGIVVDDAMRTSAKNVLALGECVEHRGKCYGLVAPLYEMAMTLAKTLQDEEDSYKGSVMATQLKVNGVKLYSAGEYSDPGTSSDYAYEDVVLRDATAGIYRRLILNGNNVAGVVLYGDTEDGNWYFDMVKHKTDISQIRDTLIFGQAYQAETTLDPHGGRCSLVG